MLWVGGRIRSAIQNVRIRTAALIVYQVFSVQEFGCLFLLTRWKVGLCKSNYGQ